MATFYLSFAPQTGLVITEHLSNARERVGKQIHDHARLAAEMLRTRGVPESNNRIPPLIHQTYKTHKLPPDLQTYQHTWMQMNPGYEYKLYDDQEAEEFVSTELPEYLEAYKALPRAVERADFFRYLVLLKKGGVYADLDVHCATPINRWINPDSRMVVGWERNFGSLEEAHDNDYVRQHQLLQWTFMAEPGHPALRELCDSIAEHAFEPEPDADSAARANEIILERTGPGAFTDVVLKWFQKDLHGEQRYGHEESKWVEILPEVAFGALHKDQWTLPGVRAVHHFHGSWKRSSSNHDKNRDAVVSKRQLAELSDYATYEWKSEGMFVEAVSASGVLSMNTSIPETWNLFPLANASLPAGSILHCDLMSVHVPCTLDAIEYKFTDEWTCDFHAKDVLVGELTSTAASPRFNPCKEKGQLCRYVNWEVDCFDPTAVNTTATAAAATAAESADGNAAADANVPEGAESATAAAEATAAAAEASAHVAALTAQLLTAANAAAAAEAAAAQATAEAAAIANGKTTVSLGAVGYGVAAYAVGYGAYTYIRKARNGKEGRKVSRDEDVESHMLVSETQTQYKTFQVPA